MIDGIISYFVGHTAQTEVVLSGHDIVIYDSMIMTNPDALTRAEEMEPVLTIDMATLTGAARVALGPQVIPFYTDDDGLADELAAAAADVGDPLWRMPLWAGYEDSLDSDIADLKNDPDGWAQAGSVTAALFLKRFAPKGPWAHFDVFAWNPRGRPGYPAGAEAQAIRALYAVLAARYPA